MLDCYEDLKILERNNLSYSFNTHSFEFLNRISVKNRIILSIFITSLLIWRIQAASAKLLPCK